MPPWYAEAIVTGREVVSGNQDRRDVVFSYEFEPSVAEPASLRVARHSQWSGPLRSLATFPPRSAFAS